ncbi:MAG: VTT domain-containing protein [Parcubacteria group bacterium]|nr:VTT domain-containing protein [Parcubacteria group bacterium]
MFDIIALIKTVGYAGLFAIVFAESGLFIGFIFPGDSLLFTAGLLASQGYLNIWILISLLFAAAVLGDNFGYYFGRKIGPRIFVKENSLFFSKSHIARTQDFFNRHGPKAVLLARFIPIVRTFTPILAGVGSMRYPQFMVYNLIGGALWSIGIPLAAYYLGNIIPGIDQYILLIAAGIVILSFMPVAFKVW